MRSAPGSCILKAMNERSLRALLAHPDTLVHLMDRTLDQVFHELEHPTARRRQPSLPRGFCGCGQNPLVAYFQTATLAFQTTLAQCADETPISRDDVDDVNRTLTRIARGEIMTFCGLCRRRHATPTGSTDAHGHHPHSDHAP